jgi:hypothetical protein
MAKVERFTVNPERDLIGADIEARSFKLFHIEDQTPPVTKLLCDFANVRIVPRSDDGNEVVHCPVAG